MCNYIFRQRVTRDCSIHSIAKSLLFLGLRIVHSYRVHQHSFTCEDVYNIILCVYTKFLFYSTRIQSIPLESDPFLSVVLILLYMYTYVRARMLAEWIVFMEIEL